MEKLITRKEAAKLLGISIATLDAARNSGLFPMCSMCRMAVCTLQMLAFRSTSQNVPIVRSRWKNAIHTASRAVPRVEKFRILAGI